MPHTRRLGYRLLAVFLGLALLLALEGGVRALERATGKPANEWFYTPVFERQGDNLITRESRRGYFVTQEFPREKAPGTVRIFVLGGSTALGFPYQGAYGLPELLRSALTGLSPSRSFEVINAAGFGYNSARVAAVAEEVLEYQPDALIVMTGHNEYLERRTGGVWELAAGRLFIGLERRLRGRQDTVRWENHDVSPDERARVARKFERSLNRIAEGAQRSGIKLVLVTCPSEIERFRPNGQSAVPAEEQARIDRMLDTEPGRAELRGWESKAPDDSWVAYEQGWATFADGTDDSAARAALRLWTRSRDLDPRPVRATTAQNEIIRRVAGRNQATLVYAERIFMERAGGIFGSYFLDHCHPSYLGQQMLATATLDGLAAAGMIRQPEPELMVSMRETWKRDYYALPAVTRAEMFYRVAFEAGVNMGRACRGYALAEAALTEDPKHEKALKLRERLQPAKDAGCLRGD